MYPLDVLKTMTWHRVAMHLVWSKDETKGSVDVWFDGQQVVSGAKAQTLADDNPHFIQVGLLRGKDPFSDAPEIVIDSGVEGDSLADVEPDPVGAAGAGGTAGKPKSEDNSGCGCRLPRGTSAPTGWSATLLLLLWAARRRRSGAAPQR